MEKSPAQAATPPQSAGGAGTVTLTQKALDSLVSKAARSNKPRPPPSEAGSTHSADELGEGAGPYSKANKKAAAKKAKAAAAAAAAAARPTQAEDAE